MVFFGDLVVFLAGLVVGFFVAGFFVLGFTAFFSVVDFFVVVVFFAGAPGSVGRVP